MSKCSICGSEHDVYKFKIHKYSTFSLFGTDSITEHSGTGNPAPVRRVDSVWHYDTICLDCAKYVWGIATDESEVYPEGYVYTPYPVKFYYCIGCNAYHIFPNARAWAESEHVDLPDLSSERFVTIYTSGRGIRECNLPPYTTASFVPYCNHVVVCCNSFINGYVSDALGTPIRTCSFCGRLVTDDWTDYIQHGNRDGYLCSDCSDSTTICSSCGERVHTFDIYTDNNTEEPLCESCYEDRRSERENDEDDEDSDNYINNYNYKPSPIFFNTPSNDVFYNKIGVSHSEPYFGIELEIDQNNGCVANLSPDRMAKLLIEEVPDFNEKFYIKYDGSLNAGLEIVSHPHTYYAHYSSEQWKDIFVKSVANNYTSHNAGTCGLHFHVNRLSLGMDRQDQIDTSFRMVLLTEVMWDSFVKFSRRTGFHYCTKHNVWEKNDTFTKFKDKARCNLSRYNAMNLSNPHTVEFRLCRGTLNYHTFIASLQFMYLIRLIALTLNNVSIANSNFGLFIETADRLGFKEFLEYSKRRGFSHKILESIIIDSDTRQVDSSV